MQSKKPGPSSSLEWIEHLAVLSTSLIWTAIALLIIVFIWGFQDARAQWDVIIDEPVPPQLAMVQFGTPTPSASENLISPSPHMSPDSELGNTSGVAENQLPQVLPETPLEGQTTSSRRTQPRHTETPSPTPTELGQGLSAESVVPTTSLLEVVPTASATPTYGPPPTSTVTKEPSSSSPTTHEGAPTRLVISSVGVDTPVKSVHWSTIKQDGKEYSIWEVADFAAGWHSTSALPGQSGNIVLAGHHNMAGEVFRYLVDIQEGDEIQLFVGDDTYNYYVEQKLIVKEKDEPLEVRQQNAHWISPSDDARLTLVTCWPYTNNTHRVIVVAKPG